MENNKKKSMKKKKNDKDNRIFKKVLKAWLVIFAAMLIVLGLVFWFQYGVKVVEMHSDAVKLVKESDYDTFKASATSLIYDADGKVIQSLKEKDVYYLTIESIPEYAKQAVISTEDKKFYSHNGVDIMANFRAVLALIRNKGAITQGGSTIDQQLARGIFLTNEISWERKVKEIFIAWQLEKKYTKDEILEFYLNNIYYNNSYYGIQAAANGYFNRSVNSLSLSQIAFLSAIPNSPEYYNPLTNYDNTISRRDFILESMREDNMITQEEYEEAIAETITVKQSKKKKRDYIETFVFDSAVKALMRENGFKFRYKFNSDSAKEKYEAEYTEWYNSYQKSLYTGGYRIYTSIDLEKQQQLQAAVDQKMAGYGYTETAENGVYTMQAAACSIDNSDGRVVAIVGGRSQESEGYTLNRAFQISRQPGSTIKPLVVYTPAIEQGYTANSSVPDVPYAEGKGPKNSGNSYSGWTTLRSAVASSRNVVAWRIFEEITPQVGMSYLKKMEFAHLEPVDYEILAPGIGGFTHGTNVVEMASGYSALANDGIWREPTCIVTILNANGETVIKDKVRKKRVYETNAARQMTDILETVLTSGTGAGLGGFGNIDGAAKTGTTDNSKDGWLCGYTPYYTTAVWVGHDQNKEVYNLYGANLPGSIWKTYMSQIHTGLPEKHFKEYTRPETSKNYEGTVDMSIYNARYGSASEEDESEEEQEASEDTGDSDAEPVTVTETPVDTTDYQEPDVE
jgi:penicillin-binding protein 1A